MANFVRNSIGKKGSVVMDVPEPALTLLKACFDEADDKLEDTQAQLNEVNSKLQTTQARLNDLKEVKYKKNKYLVDNAILDLLSKVGKMVAGMSGKDISEYEDGEEVVGDSLISELESLQSQIAELKAKEEALMQELELSKTTNQEDMIAQRVKDRRELERKVFKLLDMSEESMIAMGDRQLKEALIKQRYHYTNDTLQNKSNEAINAMFEIATLQSTSDSHRIPLIPESRIVDNSDVSGVLRAAYAEHTKQVQNAWQLNN